MEEEKRPRGRKDISEEFLQIELLVRFFLNQDYFQEAVLGVHEMLKVLFFYRRNTESLKDENTHTHPTHIRFCIMMLGKRLFRFPYRNANAIAFRFYSVYLKWSRFEYICCWSQSLCTHKTYNPHSHTELFLSSVDEEK